MQLVDTGFMGQVGSDRLLGIRLHGLAQRFIFRLVLRGPNQVVGVLPCAAERASGERRFSARLIRLGRAARQLRVAAPTISRMASITNWG